jgi:NAD(P)-dependent dehydrogenase (short-subunit alcohol dehydrogenase family)
MASERIVIMGGTSGIGLGVARLFAGRGAEVILESDRRSSMDAALAELGGLDVRGQVVDVTSEDSVSGFSAASARSTTSFTPRARCLTLCRSPKSTWVRRGTITTCGASEFSSRRSTLRHGSVTAGRSC